MVIAIDGPSGVGKSTVSRAVATAVGLSSTTITMRSGVLTAKPSFPTRSKTSVPAEGAVKRGESVLRFGRRETIGPEN